jgi:PAS domain S-box-containing protein
MTDKEEYSLFGNYRFDRLSEYNLNRLLKAYQRAIDINMICSITDRRGMIIYVNRKFCEISGYEEPELIGQNHRIIKSGHHPASFFREMWETISKGKTWQGEVKNKAKNGEYYWVDTVVLPIFDHEGAIIQYFSLRYLITEKKAAEKKNEDYRQSLEQMLTMTSHRVRKPIANCLGIFNLVENSGENPISHDKMMQLIEHMKTSAVELNNFTLELTDYITRIKSEKT